MAQVAGMTGQMERCGKVSGNATGALEGIRVIDLTSVVFGPYATQTLGDMGADVIKVEAPEGDVLRGVTPTRTDGMGVVFMNINRNKRSVVLDLKRTAHRAALDRIVATADVFIHSIRPKAAERLGITYDTLKVVNPRLIHCTAIGFASDGPYADAPAYDDIIQGLSGTADLNRRQRESVAAVRPDAAGEIAPTFVPAAVADKTAGLMVAQGILAALFHRERSGEGQAIEIPMFEAMTSFTLLEHLYGAVHQPNDNAFGYNRSLAPDRRPFPTKDGYIVMMPFTTRHWRSFFNAIGRDDLVEDPLVNDPNVRSPRIGELYALIAAATPQRTTAEWIEAMRAADVPAMPVNRLEELSADPHLAATRFFIDTDHPTEGRVRTTAPPIRFSETPASATRRPVPKLGADTHNVLREAGMSDAEIDALGEE
jgi:crotonobetainyl-CoA:carnitine CoA-transferase CaiB-like acyl-CoA transferase